MTEKLSNLTMKTTLFAPTNDAVSFFGGGVEKEKREERREKRIERRDKGRERRRCVQ